MGGNRTTRLLYFVFWSRCKGHLIPNALLFADLQYLTDVWVMKSKILLFFWKTTFDFLLRNNSNSCILFTLLFLIKFIKLFQYHPLAKLTEIKYIYILFSLSRYLFQMICILSCINCGWTVHQSVNFAEMADCNLLQFSQMPIL